MPARTTTLAILAALTLGPAGCTSGDDDRAPCPAGGIGVASADGTKCQSVLDPDSAALRECRRQVERFQEYACERAQICPDVGDYRIPFHTFRPGGSGESFSFALTNCSTGSEDLTISKVELAGDPRCAFRFRTADDLSARRIRPGETAVLRVVYRPPGPGEDHAHLRIFSNAQNFRPLVLPICGRAFKAGAAPDAGVSGGDGGSGDAGATVWRCKNVGTTIAKCHQGS